MVCFRFASYATPLRTVPAWQPARFSRGDEDDPTQYLALHPLGPLAELMRGHELRSAAQLQTISTRTWVLHVPVQDLQEITFDNAERYEITAEQLVGDDHTPCQELAARLRASQLPGVIVPSAALPGTRNVVLFGARVAAPYLTSPVSTLDIPSSITADGAGPPASLVELVRFPGDAHPALEAWSSAADFTFAEPNWTL